MAVNFVFSLPSTDDHLSHTEEDRATENVTGMLYGPKKKVQYLCKVIEKTIWHGYLIGYFLSPVFLAGPGCVHI